MMYWVLYAVFLTVAGGMVLWGLLKKERFFQYPTIAGVAWLAFFALPALSAARDPSKYSQEVLDDGGLYFAMIMLVLCSGLGWLGYVRGVKSSKKLRRFPALSANRIFWAGTIAYLVGFCSAYKQASLAGGFAQQFVGGGYYGSGFEGDFTKYNFLVPLIYMGFIVSFFAALQRFSFFKLGIILLMLPYPLATAVFLGRRSQAGTLVAGVILCFLLVKRWHLPRMVFGALLCMVPVAVYYGGAYRSASQYGIDLDSISESVRSSETVDTLLAGGYSEFDVMVYHCAAAVHEQAFNYGAALSNSLVRNYVPRQIVGESVKNALYIRTGVERAVFERYSWSAKTGSFSTGPCDAFKQFAFLGALYYYLIGYLYARLWKQAYEQRNRCAQLWYIATVYWMVRSVVASIAGVLPLFLYTLVFMHLLARFCKSPAPNRAIRNTIFPFSYARQQGLRLYRATR